MAVRRIDHGATAKALACIVVPAGTHDWRKFVTPAEFDDYRQWALARGFRECVAGPLVRSSYRAEQALTGNNAGLVNTSLA